MRPGHLQGAGELGGRFSVFELEAFKPPKYTYLLLAPLPEGFLTSLRRDEQGRQGPGQPGESGPVPADPGQRS